MPISDLLPWSRGSRLPVRYTTSETEPTDSFEQMVRLMNDFMENPFSSSLLRSMNTPLEDFVPRVDISENDKEIKVSAEVPGMNENDIQVSISDNVLSLSGFKETEKEEKGKRMHRIERSSGSFRRDIPLPVEVDEERVEALFKNGVLTVTLPKVSSSPVKGRRIFVKKE
jgi:HSP20 family protein